MAFTLLPGIDVASGHVEPAPGAAAPKHPGEVALAWQADGAQWAHLVDLDAAFLRGSNRELLEAVISELDIDVELSGGIRDHTALAWALSTGCRRVVLSTAALADPAWCARAIGEWGDRLAIALDVQVVRYPDGAIAHRLAARDGVGDAGDLWDALGWLEQAGAARYVVTDVSRDGNLTGPNVELYRAVSQVATAPLVASGGVATLQDLVALAGLAEIGVNLEGAVVGRALHTGRFTLPEALDAIGRSGQPRST